MQKIPVSLVLASALMLAAERKSSDIATKEKPRKAKKAKQENSDER